MIPTMSRITPAVWMLNPDDVVLTAQIMIAPAALSSSEKVMPISVPPSVVLRGLSPGRPGGKRRGAQSQPRESLNAALIRPTWL